MLYLLIAVICFVASLTGSICGIGGGIIIKPVLDAFGIFSVSAISFLSGCTVLSMSAYSMVRAAVRHEFRSNIKNTIRLSVGAMLGGIFGKYIFAEFCRYYKKDAIVGLLQALILFLLTFGTLMYTLWEAKIKTRQMKNGSTMAFIGLFLGLLSSFLGIGGGPMNIVLLKYCFSMKPKEAAESSLFIILLSQLASLATTYLSGKVPVVSLILLVLMASMGILGGVVGRSVNKDLKEETVNKLFLMLMIVILAINVYNIGRFLIQG